MNALIIFTLLVALMLTGMPVSIALGLTVLSFFFTMTSEPTASVALKLFTGLDKFEIMAIPFFILAGGILFPPSINLVIFSVATSGMSATGPNGEPVSTASVGDLFIAGVIPGITLATLLGITTWYRARKFDY